MPTGEQYEKEATVLEKEQKFLEAANKFGLAAQEYSSSGNPEKTRACEALRRFLAGFAKMVAATNSSEMLESKADFVKLRGLLKGTADPKEQNLLQFVDALILEEQVFSDLMKTGDPKLLDSFEEVQKRWASVADKAPVYYMYAETFRLEMMGTIHFTHALTSLKSGNRAAYQASVGEVKKAFQRLIDISNGNAIATSFYSGNLAYFEALLYFYAGRIENANNEIDEARASFKESSEAASKALKALQAQKTIPRAKLMAFGAAGMVLLDKAYLTSISANQSLLMGSPELAKRSFNRAATEAASAAKSFQEIGEAGDESLAIADELVKDSKRQATAISMAPRRGTGTFALGTGVQFMLVFFATLIAFVVLRAYNLFDVTPDLVVYIALIVAAITVFGLNAVKLKDLIVPSK